MGANLSSVNGGRTSVANATAIPAYKTTDHHRSALPESRTPIAPACAPYPSNYKSCSSNDYSGCKVAVPPAALARPSAKAVNTNRGVIAFHSAARWKEYFEASKQSNKLVVIYFTATWCGPCKYMEPAINEFAAKYSDIEIVKIDVDELLKVSSEFGIQTMPTFLIMKQGKQKDKVVGAKKEELQRKIEKHRV